MDNQPYIRPDQTTVELTVKAFLLGIILSVILAAANAYLGLFAGMTVSASIPAAVISMAILKLFKNTSILENNLVQTAASAGESLAAGVIFTFPALVLMGYWKEFNYIETTLIAACGGILGVMFTIPLRKALIVKQGLKFPEGVATAEVLKTGEEGGKSVLYLALAAVIGAAFKFFEAGAKLWHGVLDLAAVKGKTYLYFGMNLSPALIAVGYIVGLNIALVIFIGGAISWWVAIPTYVAIHGPTPGVDPVDMGYSIWNSQIRYLGVGGMLVGGIWALISIRNSLGSAVKEAIGAFKKTSNTAAKALRTELDTPMSWVIVGLGLMIVPIFLIYMREIQMVNVSLFMAVVMIVAGFLFSAVAGYMAGLVGSSNNPISGVTIATLLFASLILFMITGGDAVRGPAAAIMIAAVVCCAAAIAGDNMQDLKAGHILGGTPYKQQIMQVVGVIAAAAVMAPVLTLLNTAYGFGPKTVANPDALAAPQATLMLSVAQGVFKGGLPWNMVAIGACIGVLAIIVDEIFKKKGSQIRVPVLALAIGIYLPFELDSAMLLGGLLAFLIKKFHHRKEKEEHDFHDKAVVESNKSGLLFASGLITGEALVGIGLAIPVAIYKDGNVLAWLDKPLGSWPGIIGVVLVCALLVQIAKKAYHSTRNA